MGLLPTCTADGIVSVSRQPVLVVIINLTVYVPCTVYVCVGFGRKDVPPSPKSHSYDVTASNAEMTGTGEMVKGIQPLAGKAGILIAARRILI